MNMNSEITIKLSEETALLYQNISETEKQKIQLKISEIITQELNSRLSLDVKTPNETTILAMKNTEQKIGKTFNSVDDLLQDLHN